MDANSPSNSSSSSFSSTTPVRSQASTESSNDVSPLQTPGRHTSWNRSSSQPATLRNGAFNEISDGRWTYCIKPEKEEPTVIGFGKANIMNYKGMDKKLLLERKLKVCAVTWNINEKGVKVLNHLAKKISERGDEMDSDVFFISFQEIPTTATTFHEDAFKILEPVLNGFRLYLSHRAYSQMVVLWVGDLNFRVTVENDVDWRNPENIQDKIYDEVLKTEELATHKANKAFDGFNEAPIRFPPTHKFDPDSDNYVISTPKRIPSYTDRVLYRTRNESWIQPIKYDCMRGPSPSDHKAVFATFSILVIDKPVPESHLKQLSLEEAHLSGTTNPAIH
uniref:IPPc domain-containing protein n=1 Tax=Caenorhabditis tropicalis TaxID=1561998 RepID=A0A1I7UN94_9PELO